MKFLILISITLFSFSGFSQNLNLVYPAVSELKNPVTVDFSLIDDTLIVDFEVRTPSINAKAVLQKNEYPFQWDVVEIFLSVEGNDGNFPYYEFQLSPLNQTFQVLIQNPKKFINNIETGFQHSTQRTAQGWVGQMIIPLNNLGWNGDAKKIVGNAYAILGKSPSKSYWSLFLPQQQKPRFHQPQFFRPLL